MNSRNLIILTCACSAAAALLAGCGTTNSARTVETVTRTDTATTPQLPRTQTSAAPTAASKTRTAPAPAFTGGTSAAAGSSGGALGSAVAKLHALGFSPLATSTYDSNQTLRVLIGARSPTADERAQQAFFFDGARYLGTDTRGTSAEIRVAAQSDTGVTLSYGIYKRTDALCCSTGGTRSVRFQLDMGKLMAVDAIPSAAERR